MGRKCIVTHDVSSACIDIYSVRGIWKWLWHCISCCPFVWPLDMAVRPLDTIQNREPERYNCKHLLHHFLLFRWQILHNRLGRSMQFHVYMYTAYPTETMAIKPASKEVLWRVFASMNGNTVSVRIYADISILSGLDLIAPEAFGYGCLLSGKYCSYLP